MKAMRPKNIQEQVIVITGATSGIGLSTAMMAAAQKAKVVMNARNSKELRRCAAEIREKGGEVITVAGDISNEEDLRKIRDKALETYGRIDTWVNNAGVAIYGSLLNYNLEEEKKLFDINFWGTRMASTMAAEELGKNGGVLINIGSELSEMAPPVLGMYAASKHAVKAFTDSLRVEIRERNLPVHVCLIRPTSIATPMPAHGASRLLEGEPSLPSPLYHPDVVASIILRCAVNPKRDVFVGAQARLSSISNTLFPEITDVIARFRGPDIRQGMKTAHNNENENLNHPSRDEGEQTADYGRRILKRSLYADLTTLGFVGTFRHYLSGEGNP